MTAGKAAFHGLALSLRRAFSKGFQFDFNYTWSHSIDNGSVAESGGRENKWRRRSAPEQVAMMAPTDSSVLILGETGTGKRSAQRHIAGRCRDVQRSHYSPAWGGLRPKSELRSPRLSQKKTRKNWFFPFLIAGKQISRLIM